MNNVEKKKVTKALKALSEIGIGIGDKNYVTIDKISKATNLPSTKVEQIVKEIES